MDVLAEVGLPRKIRSSSTGEQREQAALGRRTIDVSESETLVRNHYGPPCPFADAEHRLE
jgi:hypothetical protein